VWQATKAGTVKDIYTFTGLWDGSHPISLIPGPGNKMYGATRAGDGMVFEVTTSGTFTQLIGSGHGSTATSMGAIVFDGVDTLYGAVGIGGAHSSGYVFGVNLFNNSVTQLGDLPQSGSSPNPVPALVVARNHKVVGNTTYSGNTNHGSLFSFGTDGSGVAPIFSFGSDLDVTNPSGMVRGADGTLYGMTRWGGAYGNGGLFSIAEDGSGYGVIASFLSPQSDFILGADGSFYLWTTSNSTYSSGAVSRIDVSGNVTVLYTFNGDASLGSKPMQIVFGPDGNLYGVASAGGTHKQGVLFRMGPDGSAYTVLQSFGGTGDGQQPNFLTLGSDGNLYGTTSYGGKTWLERCSA
jgi:uncharacterized repeat protein (TIGR03803 family)